MKLSLGKDQSLKINLALATKDRMLAKILF